MINPSTSPRFIKIEELVKGILRREKDFAAIDKLLYQSVAKDVYKELNLGAIRAPVRLILDVDKKTNSIILPENYWEFSSICVMECGTWNPLIINTNLKTGIVDITGIPDCGCDCGCQNEMCSAIKNYELIQEQVSIVMPDSTTKVFTGTLRKKINKNGTYVTEKIWPTQKFDNGTYVAVVMETTETFNCNLELLPCGCIKPTPENEDAIVCCAGAVSYAVDCGCNVSPDYLMKKHSHECNQFNFSEEGDRITFPTEHFKYDQVLLAYYADNKTKDILIPIVARRAMVAGIKVDLADYEKRIPAWQVQLWQNNYTKAKRVLMDKLNEVSIQRFNKSYTPQRRMV